MAKAPRTLITTILVAAVLMFGGLVYIGYNMSEAEITDEMLDAAINRYAERQQEAAIKAQEEANKPKQVTTEDVSDDDAFLGDENAPVTIVEFSEYQCPFCKRHVDQTVPSIKEKYIDTGKVKYVFRDFPLAIHEYSLLAALAAECAGDEGNEKYFEMHDALFAHQSELSEEKINELAKEIGLDMKKFTSCLENKDHEEEIAQDAQDGMALGISGTPGFLINGWLVRGAQPFSAFETLIEQELAK